MPDDESIVLDHFQNGVFRLAIENQIPIVPMTFFDCKKRFSYTFFSGRPGELRNKIYNVIGNSLLEDKSYMKSTLASKTNH